jgi:hypothetical protein
MPLDQRQVEALYADYFGELAAIAEYEFAMPVPQAEQLAHEVLLSGLRHYANVSERRAWLVAAVSCAARRCSSGASANE